MTAVGLPRNGLSASGRETQSSAFLSCPGIEPLYSGVAISTASADSIRWRNSCTSAGWRCSSSWLNGGIVARLSYEMNSTPGPPSSCAARRSRVLSESRRRLPESARTRMSGLLHGREAGREANGVSEQEAARRKRGVPADAELVAIDLALELEPEALVAPRVGTGPGDLRGQLDLAGDAADREIADHLARLEPGRGERDLGVALGVEEVG